MAKAEHSDIGNSAPGSAVTRARQTGSASLVREQLREYRRNFLVTGLGSLTIAIGLAVALGPTAPPGWIGWWLFAIAATLAPALALRPRRGVRDNEAAARRRLLSHRWVLGLHGLAWAGLWPLMHRLPEGPAHNVIAFAIVGLVTGAAITLSFEVIACVIFLTLASAPLVAHFILDDNSLGWFGPLSLGLFAALVAVSTVRGWQTFLGTVQRSRDASAMADQSRLLDQLLQNTEQGIWFLDNDGLTTNVNAAMCRLLGRPREQVLGGSVFDFFADHDLDILNHQLELRRQGHKEGYEIGILRPDGTRVECFNNATPLYDAHGVKVGSVGMWTDLTPLKRATQDLRASQTELQAVLEAFPGFIAAIDQEFRYSYVNPATARRLGRSADAVIGAAVTDILAPESVMRIRQGWWPKLARGEKVVEEMSYPAANGLAPIEVEVTRLAGSRQADGRRVFYAFGVDITARKQAQAQRERHERELHALLEAFPGYIAAIADDARYSYVNEPMARLMGRPAQEIVGRSIDEIIPDRAAQRRAEFEQLRAGKIIVEEMEIQPPDGGPVISLQMTRVAGPVGEQGRFDCYAFGIDITALKEGEARLREAKEEAERANRAKSHFMSQMSHELRTPLNAILGFGQLLQTDTTQPLPPRQSQQVQEILVAAQHLLSLINSLLELGRLEAGHFSVRLQPVGLCEVMVDALRLVENLAARQAVRLPPVQPPGTLPVVLADRTRLLQVLLNLLTNAVKYNRPGGQVELRCEVERSAASPRAVAELAADTVTIRITDQGQGLAADARDRLFEPFERLGAEASHIEGTGIGLALSRQLVRAMGGEIGVDSTPGTGSTFWVRLPLAAPDAASPAHAPDSDRSTGQALDAGPDAEGAGDTPTAPSGINAQVLYIEDNPVNALVMRAMIERIPGLELRIAEDGPSGLEAAASRQPDLILTDVQMPGMDGFEVLRRLRADPALRHIPVVAISADAMPQTLTRGQIEGFDDYLTKPVDMPALHACLMQRLRPGLERRDAAAASGTAPPTD